MIPFLGRTSSPTGGPRGAIYLEPRRAVWVVADGGGPLRNDDLRRGEIPFASEGGAVELSPLDLPALDELLADAAPSRHCQWSILAPIPARAHTLVTPALSGPELEKGVRWQLDLHYPSTEASWSVDYEVLGPTGSTPPSQSVLLLGAPNAAVEAWLTWTQKSELPIVSLAPPFPALARIARRALAGRSGVLVHDDSAFAAIFVALDGRIVHWRNLVDRTGATRPPIAREEGTRRLRESLLHCEDRFPTRCFEEIIPSGDLGSEWLSDVAEALDLTPASFDLSAAVEGAPSDLHRFAIPLGELIEE